MKKQLLLWSMLIGIFTIGNAQRIIFTDTRFEDALLNHDPKIDIDDSGTITEQEAALVTSLDVSFKLISSINGIEHFVNLESLIAFNNRLSSIDISKNVNLKIIALTSNFLTSINVINNSKLEDITVSYNDISQINISNNTELLSLNMRETGLTSIDVSNNLKLRSLNLRDNELTQINVTSNPNLSGLFLENNELIHINVTSNPNLAFLDLNNNNISQIDLSNNERLQQIEIQGNLIETLDVRSSSKVDEIYFSNNPNLVSVFMTGQPLKILNGDLKTGVTLDSCPQLEFICVDQEYLNGIYSLLEEANQLNVQVSSDCSDAGPKTFDDYFTLIPPDYNSDTILLVPVKTNLKVKEVSVYSAEIYGISGPFGVSNYSGKSLSISNKGSSILIKVLIGHKPGIYVLNIETNVGNFTKKYTKINLTR